MIELVENSLKNFLLLLIIILSLPMDKVIASSLSDIENWENKKYWLKKAKTNHVFLCGVYELGAKDKSKYQSKLKKAYEEQCTDIDSYIISNLSYFLIKDKVYACDNFYSNNDSNKEINKLSKERKDKIFQDCRSFYSKYSQDAKLKNAFKYHYKAFYFDGFTKKEIDYNSDQFSYASSKCKKKYYGVGKSDQYETCMMNAFNKFDIYKWFQ